MFDDPKKELNRLDSELRAESYEEELEQLVNQKVPELDDLFSDEDLSWLKDIGVLENEKPRPNTAPSRNRSGGTPDFRRMAWTEEEMDENTAVFVEPKSKKGSKSGKSGKPDKSGKSGKSDKGVGCLPYIILMELLGIAGMLWWWFRWMR